MNDVEILQHFWPSQHFFERAGSLYVEPKIVEMKDKWRYTRSLCSAHYPIAAKCEQYMYACGFSQDYITNFREHTLKPFLVKLKKEEEMNTDLAEKAGYDDAHVWMALVRTDVPYPQLYRFAGMIAKWNGKYTDDNLLAYVMGFIGAFLQYNEYNKEVNKAKELLSHETKNL